MSCKKIISIICMASLVFGIMVCQHTSAHADTLYPPEASALMVQHAIELASPGDIIVMPAGTFSFNEIVVIDKPLTFIGQGPDQTIINGTGGTHFTINANNVRIDNIKLVGIKSHDTEFGINIGNVQDFCITNCEFEGFKGAGVRVTGSDSRGVVSNCGFRNFADGTGYGVVVYGGGSANWDRPLKLGSENGDAVFVEDCYFNKVRHAIASSDGSKYVFRHNEVCDCLGAYQGVDTHGLEYGSSRGSRSYEIYENCIERTIVGYSGIWIRGGDGVIFNNEIKGENNPILISNTSQYPGSDFTYPATDQVRDLYIWGNTSNGTPIGATILSGHSHLFHIYPDDPNPEEGYDIYPIERPDYTPYEYPHPLTLTTPVPEPPGETPFPLPTPQEDIPGDLYSKNSFSGGTHSLGNGNTGVVLVEFDFIPYKPALNSVTGFADSDTAIIGFSSLPLAIQASKESTFNVRNASQYAALSTVGYSPNKIYHIRMTADFNSNTYDVWVTPPGENEVRIAENYDFRSDAPLIDDLGQVCLYSYADDDYSISNFLLNGSPVLQPTPTPDPEISWTASIGFSSTQGSNQWYYLQWDGTSYSEMTWDSTIWKGNTSNCQIKPSEQHPGTYNDSVRAWMAPMNGTITITGNPRKTTKGDDGVKLKIKRDDDLLWEHTILGSDTTEHTHNVQIDVQQGEMIYFILNRNNTTYNDSTFWDPVISYAESTNEETPIPADSVTISKENVEMTIGEEIILTATVLPEDATNRDLVWTSSDETVATVDVNGTVTAVAEGITTITVSVTDTDPVIADTCTVTVIPEQEEEATMTVSGPLSVGKGENFTVDIGFDSADEIYIADITVQYDEDLIEFLEYTGIDGGLSVIVDENNASGSLHFILCAKGEPINKDILLIQLKFKGNNITGTCDIDITDATLVRGEDEITGVRIYPTLAGIKVEVSDAPIPGDINGDGVVDILDLYPISRNYGKDSSASNWDTIKIADVSSDESGVPDGKIDFADLIYVARMILN